MTNVLEYSQGREPRPPSVDRGVSECDRFNHSSLGLCREGADAIRRNGRKEVVDSEWFAVICQMKEDSVGRRNMQVALLDSRGNWVNNQGCGGDEGEDALTAFTEERIRSSGNRSDSRSKASW